MLPREVAELLVRRLKAALGDMPPAVNPTAYNQVFGVLRVLELALEDPRIHDTLTQAQRAVALTT